MSFNENGKDVEQKLNDASIFAANLYIYVKKLLLLFKF